VAGLMTALARDQIKEGSTVVCTLTGHGLKDPDTAIAQSPAPLRVEPSVASVRNAILGS